MTPVFLTSTTSKRWILWPRRVVLLRYRGARQHSGAESSDFSRLSLTSAAPKRLHIEEEVTPMAMNGQWDGVFHLPASAGFNELLGGRWSEGHPPTCSHPSPLSPSRKQFEELMDPGWSPSPSHTGAECDSFLIRTPRAREVICTRRGGKLACSVIVVNQQSDTCEQVECTLVLF